MKIWKTFLSYPKHFLSSRQAAKNFLTHRIKSNFSIFKRQKYSLLTIISDNGNNNKKAKYLKIWVGIFGVGIFQGGNSPELNGEFDGWEFSGREFSRGEFS